MKMLEQMFQKTFVRDAHGRSAAWDGALGGMDILSTGLVAGTQVATEHGWRNVEALQQGDQVLTFDAGLQTLRSMSRSWSFANHGSTPMRHWPLFVPAGVLGNDAAMTLLPEQSVMVESDLGEAMFDDPFVLIPALALDGYRGIERRNPHRPIEVVVLHFETEQLVFANVGVLFHCPADCHTTILGMLDAAAAPGYELLSFDVARMVVNAMIDEDNLDAAWMRAQQQEVRYAI
jgi:hypothetical protein